MTLSSDCVNDRIAEMVEKHGLDASQLRRAIKEPGAAAAAVSLCTILDLAPAGSRAEIVRLLAGDVPTPPEVLPPGGLAT